MNKMYLFCNLYLCCCTNINKTNTKQTNKQAKKPNKQTNKHTNKQAILSWLLFTLTILNLLLNNLYFSLFAFCCSYCIFCYCWLNSIVLVSLFHIPKALWDFIVILRYIYVLLVVFFTLGKPRSKTLISQSWCRATTYT